MTRQYVIRQFPLIKEIQSEKLREDVIRLLADASEAGGWSDETASLCPVSLNRLAAKVNLIEHINSIAEICEDCYYALQKYPQRHGVSWDKDTILAGAFLHDVGKWIEYCIVDDVPVPSQEGKQRKHPLIGAILAAKYNIPDEIVHIIAMHSIEGDKSTHSAESELVRNVDRLVFQAMIHGISFNEIQYDA